jgi:hypothetical protein
VDDGLALRVAEFIRLCDEAERGRASLAIPAESYSAFMERLRPRLEGLRAEYVRELEAEVDRLAASPPAAQDKGRHLLELKSAVQSSGDAELVGHLRTALRCHEAAGRTGAGEARPRQREGPGNSGWALAALAALAACLIILLIAVAPPQDAADVANAGSVDAFLDPVQEPYDGAALDIHIAGGDIKLTPMRRYAISGRLVSKKYYDGLLSYDGTNADIAPVDLCLAWGDMAAPGLDRYVSYSQGGRYCNYRYSADSPRGKLYIRSHAANNHIIPANQSIRAAIDSLRVGQYVRLDGFLVRASGDINGRAYTWVSSLTRDDEGSGACELVYVTRVTAADPAA